MRKKGCVIGLTIVLMLTACSKVEEAIVPQDLTTDSTEKSSGFQSNLEERAQQEGVSTQELQETIETLTVLTAERHGDTAEAYKAALAADGKTPFEVFTAAADQMGVTLKAYLEAEQNKAPLSEEDRETVQGMNEATKALENAFDSNTVEGGLDELLRFEVEEVLHFEDTKATNGFYEITYTTSATFDATCTYFSELLEGSEYYMVQAVPGAQSKLFMGTLNGELLNVIIDNETDKTVTQVEIAY